jgi:hypothetical protein
MKIKVQVIVTREIEIDPSVYPEGSTDEQILQSEISYADDLFHEWAASDDVVFETKGEILPDDPK